MTTATTLTPHATQPADGMPAIIVTGENGGADTWLALLAGWAGYHVQLHLAGGDLIDAQIVTTGRDTHGMPTITVLRDAGDPFDAQAVAAVTYSADDLVSVYVH